MTANDTPSDEVDVMNPDFIQAVRNIAGTRASPRQISVAGQALEDAGFEVNAESIAGIIELTDGEYSKRQRRNNHLWRRLGADLAIRGQDGTPEGQRLFLGQVRKTSGPKPSEQFLLALSLAVAVSTDDQLNPRFTGRIAKQHKDHNVIPGEEELLRMVQAEFERRRRLFQDRRKRESFQRHFNPGRRRWRPGGNRARRLKYSDRIQHDETAPDPERE